MTETWKEDKIFEMLNKDNLVIKAVKEIISKQTIPLSLILLTKPENYRTTKKACVKQLLEKFDLIIVSLNSTYERFVKDSEIEKEVEKIKYIDMFSQKQCIEKNKVCLGSNTALSECNDYIEKFVEQKKKSCVLVDSVTALLLYNDEKAVKKFIHYLSQKLLEKEISCVLLGIQEKETENTCKILNQFVKTIEKV
ncbi:MAG: ATPase domain-containing protein [Candidatus Diapherotrites archaeon]